MTDIAIKAENLSKSFHPRQSKSTSLKEALFKKASTRHRSSRITIDALKKVSFTLTRGKALGVIGSNGSGKTTLLKCISGITQPTSGTLEVNGTVASLIELSAGFHFDLTGMENIYLQGSLYGLKKKEIDVIAEAIVRFADIGKFINTPIKHYSSGMIVRLGFAIASFLDPDILLLDEVMAVGDLDFQPRSFAKIKEFKKKGKTIILVSHDLEAIRQISDLILWLEKGEIRSFGDSEKSILNFHGFSSDKVLTKKSGSMTRKDIDLTPHGRFCSEEAEISDISISDDRGTVRTVFSPEEHIHINVAFKKTSAAPPLYCSLGLNRFEGTLMGIVNSNTYGVVADDVDRGCFEAVFEPPILTPGKYILSVALGKDGTYDVYYDVMLRMFSFTVEGGTNGIIQPVVNPPVAFSLHSQKHSSRMSTPNIEYSD